MTYAQDEQRINEQLALLSATAEKAESAFFCHQKPAAIQYLRNLTIQSALLIEQISTMHERAAAHAESPGAARLVERDLNSEVIL